MKKFPVLLISSEFPPGPGGIGKHAYDLARALTTHGHEVTVCASQDFSSEEEADKFNSKLPKELKFIRFIRSGITTQLNRWTTIRKEINRLQPGMIIVSGRFSLWMGYAIRKWYGKKIPMHAFVHGSEFKKNNSIHHFLTLRSLKSIPFIWSVSEFTKQLMESKTGRKNTLVLPNGLWINDWSENFDEILSSEQKGKPALITVGRVSRRKGQHRVVNALPELLNTYPGLHYHIIGIADSSQPVAKLAANLGMENNITFHGRIPSLQKLASLYRAAGVFIMLSENQPDGDNRNRPIWRETRCTTKSRYANCGS